MSYIPKGKFGVAIEEEMLKEVDELVAEYDDLRASRSEIVEAILTAFIHPESDHTKQVRGSLFGDEKVLSGHL